MGKEVSLFENYTGQVPAHLRGEVSNTTKALMGGGGTTKRISIRGSVWRLMLGTEEITKNEDRSMNFIVVGSAPAFARTYYGGQYKEGENKPPLCWSDDGKAPSHLVEDKQGETCANCPMNVKGSGDGDSRACRYSARIAVLLDGDIEGDVYGMSVPATSLFGEVKSERYKSLQRYAQELATHGFDIRHVVTEMRFDSDSDVPKIMFRAVRPLNEEEWAIVKDLEGTEELEEHIGPRVFSPAEEGTSEATSAVAGAKNPADADESEDEPEDEPAEEEKPKRTRRRKTAESEEPAAEKPKRTRGSKPKTEPVEDEEESDDVGEPQKREKSKGFGDDIDPDLEAIIGEWGDDDEDDFDD